jgi:hypothetical protein
MTYGLDRRALNENETPTALQRPWRQLDGQSRLRLIERELNPAGEGIDGYPLAL